MRASDIDRIKALPLFADAAAETFRVATAGAHVQRFPPGTMLLLEGDPGAFWARWLTGDQAEPDEAPEPDDAPGPEDAPESKDAAPPGRDQTGISRS